MGYGGKSIETYMSPGEKLGGTTHGVGWGRRNYHPGQSKGDQTDYGEYNIVMLEYLASRSTRNSPIELDSLIPHWQRRLTSPSWGAWRCTMTKQTLQQIESGMAFDRLGGMSNAMAVRSAAAMAAFDDEDAAAKAARAMMFTHRNEEALSGGDFLRALQVEKGIRKFEEATDATRALSKEEFVDDLAMTSMARLWDVGKTEPIKVGKASPTEGTLPSSVYIILKYADDFVAAAN